MSNDHCRTCGAEIFWTKNENTGAPMLFDAEPTAEPGDPDQRRQLWVIVGDVAHRARAEDSGPLYTTHWGTCPDAKDWKGKTRDDMRSEGRLPGLD